MMSNAPPYIAAAFEVIAKFNSANPDFADDLRSILPALANNFAKNGKAKTVSELHEIVQQSLDGGLPLTSHFNTATPKALTYHSVFTLINGYTPPEPESAVESVKAANSAALKKNMTSFFQSSDIERLLKIAISNGDLDSIKLLLQAHDNPTQQAFKVGSQASHECMFHIVEAFETNMFGLPAFSPRNKKHKTALSSLIINTLSDQKSDRYRQFLRLRRKFPAQTAESLIGLEGLMNKHFNIKYKEYLKIRDALSHEIPNVMERNAKAFEATVLFQSLDRLLKYTAANGTRGRTPIETLLNRIDMPLEPDIDWPAWGDALLKHGSEFSYLVNYADKITTPVRTPNGGISMRLTRSKLETLAFERLEENPEIARLCFELELSEDVFNETLNVWNYEYQPNQEPQSKFAVPDIMIDGEEFRLDGYQLEKLPYDDPRILFLGEYTGCCEKITGHFEETIIHALDTHESGFYVLTKDDVIKAHTWVWRGQEGQLIIDGYESIDKHVSTEVVSDITEAICTELQKGKYAKYQISCINLGMSAEHLTPTELLGLEDADNPSKRFILATDEEYYEGQEAQWLVRDIKLSPM